MDHPATRVYIVSDLLSGEREILFTGGVVCRYQPENKIINIKFFFLQKRGKPAKTKKTMENRRNSRKPDTPQNVIKTIKIRKQKTGNV